MIITTQLTQRDYINVNFLMMFRRPVLLISLGIMCCVMLTVAIVKMQSAKGSLLDLLPLLIVAIIFPLSIYRASIRNFKGNARISERIAYHMEPESLSIKGESFSSESTWEKLYQVRQTKNWVLIYQNRQVASVIGKRDISVAQIGELKGILDTHGVKNNL